MLKVLKKIYRVIKRRLGILTKIFKVRTIVNMETYYPECKRKNKIQRYIDNYRYLFKYCDINLYYNLYRMDLKQNNNTNDYCDYRSIYDKEKRV